MTPYQERVLADGATSYWPLDDPAGSPTARDLAGPLTGDVLGSTLLGVPGPGPTATAANFVAANFDAYVKVPLTTIPQVATIEAWFRRKLAVDELIFSNRWGADVPVSITVTNALALILNVDVAGVSAATPDDSLWHHLVAVIDGVAGTLSLYLDGVNATISGALTLATACTSTAATIGGNDDNTYSYWDGDLADLAIYPRVLTQAEVTAHFTLQTADPAESWAPIDSAPTDGRDLLVARVPSGRQLVVHWSPAIPPDGAWVGDDPTRPVYPTHWRALPVPPPAAASALALPLFAPAPPAPPTPAPALRTRRAKKP